MTGYRGRSQPATGQRTASHHPTQACLACLLGPGDDFLWLMAGGWGLGSLRDRGSWEGDRLPRCGPVRSLVGDADVIRGLVQVHMRSELLTSEPQPSLQLGQRLLFNMRKVLVSCEQKAAPRSSVPGIDSCWGCSQPPLCASSLGLNSSLLTRNHSTE